MELKINNLVKRFSDKVALDISDLQERLSHFSRFMNDEILRQKKHIVFLALILLPVCAPAQRKEVHFTEDTERVYRYLESAKDSASPNELIVKAALSLLNTPYVAHTLEGNREEELVVNLMELDCTTLVENCLALSRAAQDPDPDYEDFVRELQSIRYRAGRIDGYTSRLHYTTDWITDNSGQGMIEDITGALGGKRFQPQVNFMSSHPDRYPALKDNPQDVEVMRTVEQTINQRDSYYYIPKNEIQNKQLLIKSGDIIGFTTSIPGLDISHVAIAYWNKGRLSFIHASTKDMKVVVNPESLVDYCKGVRTNTGIVVLRAKTLN